MSSNKNYLQICKSVQNLISWHQNCKSLIAKTSSVLHMFIKTANNSFKNYFLTNLQISSNKNYLQICKCIKTWFSDTKTANHSLLKLYLCYICLSKLQTIHCKCCVCAAKLILRNYKSGNVSTQRLFTNQQKSVQNLIRWHQNCKSLITKNFICATYVYQSCK